MRFPPVRQWAHHAFHFILAVVYRFPPTERVSFAGRCLHNSPSALLSEWRSDFVRPPLSNGSFHPTATKPFLSSHARERGERAPSEGLLPGGIDHGGLPEKTLT